MKSFQEHYIQVLENSANHNNQVKISKSLNYYFLDFMYFIKNVIMIMVQLYVCSLVRYLKLKVMFRLIIFVLKQESLPMAIRAQCKQIEDNRKDKVHQFVTFLWK